MESAIEEIKKRIDIAEFIGSYITLKKAGRNFKANCPFHSEKTPSFVISTDRQIWHCFGACHEGGDIIKFLMKMESITFYEAVKELARKANVAINESAVEDQTYQKKERLIQLNILASDYFHFILTKSPYGKRALEYLKNRGIDEKLIETFRLGYAPDSWDSLQKFLSKKKFTREEMLNTGLLVVSEKGGVYDRFRGRLIFPLIDTRETVVGFSGRVLEGDGTGAKYMNTPETLLYHKRDTLYGIHLAKDEIKKQNNVYIVEGEFDMISPYASGLSNIVAIKGSALTREQLTLLKRYTNRITLMLDADIAGEDAAKRGIEEAEAQEFEIDVVLFDFAKDPDEAVRQDPVRFKEAIKQSMPFYDFMILSAQKKYPGHDAFSKKQIGEEVAVFFSRIKNPIVKSHYVKKLATILDVSERSIEELIMKTLRTRKQKFVPRVEKKDIKKENREMLLQYYLLSLLFQDENPYKVADLIFTVLTPEDFSIPSHKELVKLFLDYQTENKELFTLKTFFTKLPSQLRAVFDEIYLYATAEEGAIYDTKRLAYEVRRFALKRKLNELLTNDQDSKELREEAQKVKLMLNEVEKKLVTLYN